MMDTVSKTNQKIIFGQNVTNMNTQIMLLQENILSKKNQLKLSSPCLLLSGMKIYK